MITFITVHFVTRSPSLYQTTASLPVQTRKLLSRWNCLIPSLELLDSIVLALWKRQLKPLLSARPKEIRCFSSRYANGQRFLFDMDLIIILRFPLEGASFPFRAIWRIHGFSFLYITNYNRRKWKQSGPLPSQHHELCREEIHGF